MYSTLNNDGGNTRKAVFDDVRWKMDGSEEWKEGGREAGWTK